MEEQKVNRNYKDTVFRMVFHEKEALLSLYNAINGTSYENAADLEINTLENAIYMSMKNDVSFIFQFYLNLYEHQSTYNPNMPLRNLFYISRQLEKQVEKQSLYSTIPTRIPTPKFVVFYNGESVRPEREVQKLSDLFLQPMEEAELELKVQVFNLRPGMNKGILEACQILKEYCLYVERVRKYAKTKPIEEAVERAVEECIREGILKDFLISQRAEVTAMSIFEYNEEEELRKYREAERAYAMEKYMKEGLEKGKEQGIKQGIKQGEEQGKKLLNELNRKLLEEGRTEDLLKSTTDENYQKQLLKEYQLWEEEK